MIKLYLRLMETSLCSDYATYDRIIQDINTYSKQATSIQPVEPDYVSYDNAISNNLTRSRSADLNGYVSAEVCLGHPMDPGIGFYNYTVEPV